MDELEALKLELEHYKSEKEKIRNVIGQIGGTSHRRRDAAVNAVFLILVVGFFVIDITRQVLRVEIAFLPPLFLLEIAVLLVSLKIVWMIHVQAKVDHFQFWILNSVEFQMNMIARRITAMEQALRAGAAYPPADPGGGDGRSVIRPTSDGQPPT